MSLAEDDEDGNGLQLEKLSKFFKLFSRVLKKIDVNGRGLFSLCKLRLCLPVDVKR